MNVVEHHNTDIVEINTIAINSESQNMRDIYKSLYQLFISIPIVTYSILICIFNYVITVINIIGSNLGTIYKIQHIPTIVDQEERLNQLDRL